MNNTIAILFCIWVVSEVVDNVKKYKMEKTHQFAVETLREEFQKMKSEIEKLKIENHHLHCMVHGFDEDEMG